MNKIRIIIDGVGMVGSQIVRKAIHRNVEIVGAVDQYDKIINKDLGEHIGIEKMNILIKKNLEEVIKRTTPDLVIICSKTNILDIESDIKTCILNKVDVLTSSEHCYFWKLTDLKKGIEIDNLAKQYGVTVCASGVQDMNWNIIPYALSAMCHKIERIEGKTLAIIDDFGTSVIEEAFVGNTLQEFEQKIRNLKTTSLDAFTISLYLLAEKLQLHIKNKKIKFEPVISEKELFCKALNKNIPVGNLIGYIAKTELETEENIFLSCSFISKLKEEKDTAYNKWFIKGIPDMSFTIDDMHGELTTTSCMINRIPDILNAKAGFITINDLPVPYFKMLPLNEYVNCSDN